MLGFYKVLSRPETWRHNLEQLDHITSYLPNLFHDLFSMLFGMLRGPDAWWGPSVMLTLLIVAVIVCARTGNDWPLVKAFLNLALMAIVVAIVVAPMLGQLDQLFLMVGRAALIWFVPGLVLGSLVPLLRSPSENPGKWAAIAFAAAAILLLLTLARWEARWWLLVVLFAFLLLGALCVLRSKNNSVPLSRVEDFWPLIALSVATVVCGLTLLMQEVASFAGVYQHVHTLSHLNPRMPHIAPAGKEPDHKPLGSPYDLFRFRYEGIVDSPWTRVFRARTTRQSAEKLRSQSRDILERHTIAAKQMNQRLESIRDELKSLPVRFPERMERLAEFQDELLSADADRRNLIWVAEQMIKACDALKEEKLTAAEELEEEFKIERNDRLFEAKGFTQRSSTMPKVWRDEINKLNPAIRNNRDEAINYFSNDKRILQNTRAELQKCREEELAPLEREPVRWFEVAINASVGFWVTAGLLAGWSIFNNRINPRALHSNG